MDGDIPSPSEVIDAATDPIEEVASVTLGTISGALHELAEAIRIQTDVHTGNRDALGRIEANLADVVNRITSAAEDVADAVTDTAGNAVEIAADAPVAGAEGIEAVVEDASAPPSRKPRGMLGRTRNGRRR